VVGAGGFAVPAIAIRRCGVVEDPDELVTQQIERLRIVVERKLKIFTSRENDALSRKDLRNVLA
jgi:hypothetical protein